MTTELSPPTDSDSRDMRLVDVLDRYERALKQGMAPPIEPLLLEHPDLADELRDALETLRCLWINKQSAARKDAEVVAAHDWFDGSDSNVIGDYRLIREIGRGGMGVVYEAEELLLKRRVALKLLPLAALLDTTMIERFRNEARAAAQLHHPHIVPIYGVGTDRGVHYYSMPLISGRTLAQVIHTLSRDRDSAATLPLTREDSVNDASDARTVASSKNAEAARSMNTPDDACDFVTRLQHSTGREFFRCVVRLGIQAAQALEHAHLRGIVHRDIKPSNLLLDEQGKLWVADFGLAQMRNVPGMTMTGDVVGTLRYMSPEQAAGRRVIDHRSDVFSLCSSLYELATQQPVVASGDRATVVQAVLSGEIIPPRRLNPEVPIELETILLKGLTHEPESRYQSALELADDLQRFLDDRPLMARRPTVFEQIGKWVRRHRSVVTVGAVSGVVLLVSVTVLMALNAIALQEKANQARLATETAQEASRKSGLLLARSVRLGSHSELKAAARQALIDAAKIRPGVDLRNEAIASMSRWQFEPIKHWDAQVAANLHSVDFTADLSRYAEETGEGTISIRRTDDAEEEVRLPAPQVAGSAVVVSMLKLSPDGRTLAAVYRATKDRQRIFILWNVAERREIERDDQTAADHPMSFSPDGRWCARGTSTGDIVLYDILSPSNEPLRLKLDRQTIPKATVWECIFSHDSRLLAVPVRFSGDVEIWDVTTRERVKRLKSLSWVTALAWSPNNRELLFGSRDGSIAIWDFESGKPTDTMRAHASNVHAMTMHPEMGLLTSYSWGGSSAVWDFASRERVLDLRGADSKFSRDGRRFVSRSGVKLTLWDMQHLTPSRSLFVPQQTKPEVLGALFVADDRVLVSYGSDGVRLWDVATGEPLGMLVNGWIAGIEFDEARQTLIVAERRVVSEWPLTTTRDSERLRLRFGPPTRSSAVAGYWITTTGQNSDRQVRAVAMRSATSGLIRVQRGNDFPGTDHPALPIDASVAVSPQGDLIAIASRSGDGPALQIRDAVSFKLLRELPDRAVRVAFHPQRDELVVAGRDNVRFLNLHDWQPRLELARHESDLAGQVAFNRDGSILAYGTRNHLVRLVLTETGEELATFERTPRPERGEGIAFSRDGGWMATAFRYQAIELWNLRTIRSELRDLGLDWQHSGLTPAAPALPLTVDIQH